MDDKIEKAPEQTPKFTEPKVRQDKIWKAVALIAVCAVVFTAVGYYAGQNNPKEENTAEATKTTDLSSIIQTKTTTSSASATVDVTENWKTYANDKYGFSLTAANDWTGYKVFDWSDSNTESPAPAEDIYTFCLPTTSQSFDINHKGYACPFKINVYTKATYDSLNSVAEQQQGLSEAAGRELGEKNGFVFITSMWQDVPEDIIAKGIDKEVDSVLSTFQFTK